MAETNSPVLAPGYSLREVVLYFFKLGYTGFGGPVALVGYMHRDLVEKRKWISEDSYKEGLTLAQLAPGPLAAQLSIYLGFVHYRIIGATLTGLAFVFPSFCMVVGLGMLYKLFGGLPWMQAAFYSIGAAVTGIIAMSAYKLTTRSVSRFKMAEVKTHWLLWMIYLAGILITIITQSEQLLLFVGAGILYMLVKASPPIAAGKKAFQWVLLSATGFWDYQPAVLGKIALFFLKAGTFVFGSGLAIVPFLQNGVVKEYHWLNEQQFLDAVAVAMITPGPVVITVGFVGYLVAGFPGAIVAALATFLPCYLFTVIPAPYYKRFAQNLSIKAFVEGITAAIMGSLSGAVIIIARKSIIDIPTAIIAGTTVFSLLYLKRLREPYIILIAACIGLVLKMMPGLR